MWPQFLLLALVLLYGGAYCQENDIIISEGSNTSTLRKGDLPAGVRSILIENTRQVTVEEDAVSALHSLVNITIEGVERLVIKRDGLALQHHSRLLYITIRNVDSLRVESGAFSGRWQRTATLHLHNIGDLRLGCNAFSYQTREIGPITSQQHMKLLNLDRDGFVAPLFRLALNNITMAVCHGKTFDGNVLYSEFKRVTIDVAEAGCFHGRNNFTHFNFQHLKINTVHPQAFSGTFNELTIKDSEFTTIEVEGFKIAVRKMKLTESSIKELLPNGLTVSASETTLLERVHIDYLRQNGLVGLKMRENVKGLVPTLTIRDLQLLKTESGSLTFSDCTKLQLTDLRLIAPRPQICPTERWTRALSGGGVSGQLSSAQFQIFGQLKTRDMCPEKDRTVKTPSVVDRPYCEAGNRLESTDPTDIPTATSTSNSLDYNIPTTTSTSTSLDDVEHTAAPIKDGREASTEDDTTESDGSHGDKSGQGESNGDDLSRDSKEGSEETVSATNVKEMPAPGESQTKAATSDSEGSLSTERPSDIHDSGAQEPSHDRLVLGAVLGAVLVLMVVVGIVFMLMRADRNHGRQQSANVRDAVLIAVMESLVEGSSSKMEKGSHGETSGDTGCDSTRPSVEYHQDDEIRDPVKTGEGPLMTPSQADANPSSPLMSQDSMAV